MSNVQHQSSVFADFKSLWGESVGFTCQCDQIVGQWTSTACWQKEGIDHMRYEGEYPHSHLVQAGSCQD